MRGAQRGGALVAASAAGKRRASASGTNFSEAAVQDVSFNDEFHHVQERLHDQFTSSPTTTVANEEGDTMTGRAAKVISNPAFTFAVACAIMLNVLTMTLQVDNPEVTFQPGCEGSDCLILWDVLDEIFLLFFTVELTLRLVAFGCTEFFCKPDEDQGWNIFDFFVVSTCWMIFFFQSVHFAGGKFVKLLRSARMLRILRVLRIFRLPCMKKLNIIVAGLVASFTVVFWIAVMLGGVMFISAIVCTDFVGKHAERWGDEADEIRLLFGSMKNSTITLFNFLTLADWSGVTRLVMKQEPGMTFFFLSYVIFAAMVILSLLTGVLADHMNTVREAEEQEEVDVSRKEQSAATRAEFKAFKEADREGTHLIGKEQFLEVLQDSHVRKELEDCGVDLESFDPEDIFQCFDSKASGTITWSEFRSGMEELRLGVTPKQIFKLEVSLRRAVRECCEELTDELQALERKGSWASPEQAEGQLCLACLTTQKVCGSLGALQNELDAFQVPAGFVPSDDEDDGTVE